jgi:hypothetical protein
VIRLEDTPDAIVRNCRAFKRTEVFLATRKDDLKEIVLEGNELQNAVIPTEESDADSKSQ